MHNFLLNHKDLRFNWSLKFCFQNQLKQAFYNLNTEDLNIPSTNAHPQIIFKYHPFLTWPICFVIRALLELVSGNVAQLYPLLKWKLLMMLLRNCANILSGIMLLWSTQPSTTQVINYKPVLFVLWSFQLINCSSSLFFL